MEGYETTHLSHCVVHQNIWLLGKGTTKVQPRYQLFIPGLKNCGGGGYFSLQHRLAAL